MKTEIYDIVHKNLEAKSIFPSQAGYSAFFDDELIRVVASKCVSFCHQVGVIAELANRGEVARKTKATADGCAKFIEDYFEMGKENG